MAFEGPLERCERSIPCFGRNCAQLVAAGAQSHGGGADAKADDIVLGWLTNQFAESRRERGSRHRRVPRQRLNRPRLVGFAMDRRERSADLVIPSCRQPTGMNCFEALVEQRTHGMQEQDIHEPVSNFYGSGSSAVKLRQDVRGCRLNPQRGSFVAPLNVEERRKRGHERMAIPILYSAAHEPRDWPVTAGTHCPLPAWRQRPDKIGEIDDGA